MQTRATAEELLYAAINKQYDFIINAILDDPSCLTLALSNTKSLMHLACENKAYDLLELITKLDVVDKEKYALEFERALLFAAYHNSEKMVDLLLRYNVKPVQHFDDTGNYCLHNAVVNHHETIIFALLKADITYLLKPDTVNKKTPIELAEDSVQSLKALTKAWYHYLAHLNAHNELKEALTAHPLEFASMSVFTNNYEQILRFASFNPELLTMNIKAGLSFFWLAKKERDYLIAEHGDQLLQAHVQKKDFNNALLIAVITNKIEKVQELLKSGASVHFADPLNNKTALAYAFEQPNPSVSLIVLLLKHRAKLSAKDKDGNNVFALANQHAHCKAILLQAFKQYCNELSDQALFSYLTLDAEQKVFIKLLIETEQLDLLKKLIAINRNIIEVKIDGDTTLIHDFAQKQNWEMVDFIAATYNADKENTAQFSQALFYAVKYNNTDSVTLLLDANAPLFYKPFANSSPSVKEAITTNCHELVTSLLLHSTNFSLEFFNDCYDHAVKEGHKDAFKQGLANYLTTLINNKLTTALQNNPAFFAKAILVTDDFNLFKQLIALHPGILTDDIGNRKFMDLAGAYKSWKLIANILANFEMDPQLARLAATLIYAIDENEIKLVKQLLEKGAPTDEHFVSTNIGTLHTAIKNKNADIIQLLLRFGVNLNHTNKNGETPEQFSKNYSPEILQNELTVYHNSLASKETMPVLIQGQRQLNSYVSALPDEVIDTIANSLRTKDRHPLDSVKDTKDKLIGIGAQLCIEEYNKGYLHIRSTNSRQHFDNLSNTVATTHSNAEEINKNTECFVKDKLTESTEKNQFKRSRAITLILKYHLLSNNCVEQNPKHTKEYKLAVNTHRKA